MILVTIDSFKGYKDIAISNQTRPELQDYIDRYEKLYILKLLGVDLGNKFIADIQNYDAITPIPQGDYDASTGIYPTVGSGGGGSVAEDDSYTISVAGTINSIDYKVGDIIYALADTPTADQWGVKQYRFTFIENPFDIQSGENNFWDWGLWSWPWAEFNGWWCEGGEPIYNSYGMEDLLTCLIYYHYIAYTQYQSSQGGTTSTNVETGTNVGFENAVRAGEKKWNDALNQVGAIQFYCAVYNKDNYPEYKGNIFKPKFSALL